MYFSTSFLKVVQLCVAFKSSTVIRTVAHSHRKCSKIMCKRLLSSLDTSWNSAVFVSSLLYYNALSSSIFDQLVIIVWYVLNKLHYFNAKWLKTSFSHCTKKWNFCTYNVVKCFIIYVLWTVLFSYLYLNWNKL